ncbi:MAG: sugar fermentation stimulation protein SfsA, partial [Myxococcota bacterium]
MDPSSSACVALLRIPHPRRLVAGALVGRYDRFVADVRLADGRVVHAHCVNPGRMEGLVRPGCRVWLSPVPKANRRKLRYTWELTEDDGFIVGANTGAPNRIVEAVLARRVLPGF